MLRLLFLSHAGSHETPMAEFIMEHLIQEHGLATHLSVDSACLDSEGLSLSAEGQAVLKAHGIPATMKKAFPLEWKTYDEYDFILLMEEDTRPFLFNILGGDVDEKIHLLSEYGEGNKNIPNPGQGVNLEDAFQEEEAACLGLLKKLEDWVR